MKPLFIPYAVVASILLVPSGRAQPPSRDPLLASIFRIDSRKCAPLNLYRTGTGFFIEKLPGDAGSGVVTALHSVVGRCEISVVRYGTDKPVRARVTRVNRQLDLAVVTPESPIEVDSSVKLSWETTKPATLLGGSWSILRCGTVTLICRPRDNVTIGDSLTTLHELLADPFLDGRQSPDTSAPMLDLQEGPLPGDSGSPIIRRKDRKVIGIIGGGYRSKNAKDDRSTTAFNWAVPAWEVKAWQDPNEAREKIALTGIEDISRTAQFFSGREPKFYRNIEFVLVREEIAISSFYMAVNEVARKDWNEWRAAIRGAGEQKKSSRDENLPQPLDTPEDGQKFCDWLAPGRGRLPNILEWEWAAKEEEREWKRPPELRACVNARGTSRDVCPTSSFRDSSDSVVEVGRTKLNDLGIRDLLGNVWEWAGDSRHGYERKGGSYEQPADQLAPSLTFRRAALRSTPATGATGFRCVVPVAPTDGGL
jgi:hypothetical protein